MILIIYYYINQLVVILGPILVLGSFIKFITKKIYSSVGTTSKYFCYFTGAIGTPIHEFSHALFCVIFRHKIIEIKWFQTNSEDGVLGYVNHSYNPKNIYQQIGNFFIGIAPIIVISSLVFAFAYFIIPEMALCLIKISTTSSLNLTITSFVSLSLDYLLTVISYTSTVEFWLFFILTSIVCLHMSLSKEDVKGALKGVSYLLVLLVLVNIILFLISIEYVQVLTSFFVIIGSWLSLFLLLSLTISILLLILIKIKSMTPKLITLAFKYVKQKFF